MNVRAFVAEFIGTFALCWVGILAINNFPPTHDGLLGIAVAHGLALGILVTVTMAVSGGHLNPAVTVAMLMTRRIKLFDALMYIIVQVGGGLAAALLINSTMDITVVALGTPDVATMISGAMVEQQRDVAFHAFILEAIATFFLVFAVFGSTVDKRAHKMGGLFVGAALVMGVLAIGPMTGAALNPARWIGPAMLTRISAMDFSWLCFVYILGPIAGGIVAGLVYQYVMMGRDQIPGLSPKSEVE